MKENTSLIRVAAILYADDNQNIKTKTIIRKIVEAILFDDNNKEKSNHQVIDEINTKLKLVFSEDEITESIDKSDNFEFRQDVQNKDTFYIKLTAKRNEYLKQKIEKNTLDFFIEKFVDKIYHNDISQNDLKSVLYKYIYALVNTNIDVFNKILKAKKRTENIIVDANLFAKDERKAINAFLSWDNNKKNKSLFDVISYSIEYCLLTNNLNGDNIFANSVKSKIFYLDNNIIYRALGVNGVDRQNRINTFLSKCKQNGQELLVSKYTYKEFYETIDYHIEKIQEIPSNRVNPDLFDKYDVDPGFYDFYHKWKKGKPNSNFVLFRAYVQSQYKTFLKKYQIDEDFKIPFDEKDKKVDNIIKKYVEEIKGYKKYGNEDSHIYDALNTYLVENKREHNNVSITDTKYFFVSTDQKLRDWDFNRNDYQPIALLPSQWLSILLKYVSRTEDDYSSFVSFIKLKKTEKSISKDDVHIILASISEITEEFDVQEEIFDFVMNRRLDEIINKKSTGEKIKKIRSISKDFIERKYESENIELKKELEKTRANKIEVEKHLEQENKIQNEENIQKEIRQNKELIKNLLKLKSISESEADRKYKLSNFILISIIIVGYIAIELIVKLIGWDFVEPKTWSIGAIAFVIGLLYLMIFGESFNPKKYFEKQKNIKITEAYKKYDFNPDRLKELVDRNKKIEKT